MADKKNKKMVSGKDLQVTLKSVDGEPVHQGKGKAEFYQGKDKPSDKKPEAMLKPAIVMNRLPHDATIAYDGRAMKISPRQRSKIANMDKLGALPKGVTVMPLRKK